MLLKSNFYQPKFNLYFIFPCTKLFYFSTRRVDSQPSWEKIYISQEYVIDC
jgi:hypothetical protein